MGGAFEKPGVRAERDVRGAVADRVVEAAMVRVSSVSLSVAKPQVGQKR